MKLKYQAGCIVYGVEIDDVNTNDIKKEDLKSKLDFTIENIPYQYHYKSYILLNIITDIITGCKNTETKEIEFSPNEDDILYISILNTKNFRIRDFYDSLTQEDWVTINDYYVGHDYLQYQFGTLQRVLLEVVDELYNNPSVDDPTDFWHIANEILSTIVYNFGILTNVNDRCNCCGDNIETYELNI